MSLIDYSRIQQKLSKISTYIPLLSLSVFHGLVCCKNLQRKHYNGK
jgi:hypothetical protein